MNRNTAGLTVVGAFVVGCVAAPLAQQLVVRPAGAAPEGVRKWQQYCASTLSQGGFGRTGDFTDIGDKLNEDLTNRGAEGWELVTVAVDRMGTPARYLYCFRRPVP